MPSDPDNVLSIVSALYDASLDAEAWPRALDQLSDFTGAQFAHLFFDEPGAPEASGFATISNRAPDASLNRYHARYEALDPRREAAARQPAGIVVPDWAMVSQDEFVRTEFYNDFYTPLGLRWLACSSIIRSPSFVAILGLIRGVDDEPYSADDCARAAYLLPHLARAVIIQRRVGGLEADMRAGFAALDRLAVGIVVLGDDGRPVFSNRAAEKIFADDDGLQCTRGAGLTAMRHRDTRALQAAVQRASSVEALCAIRDWNVVRVARPSLKRPYLVMAAPASRRGGAIRRDQRAATYVVIQDPDARVRLRGDLLAALYGLTPAETDVASRLASGASLQTIAQRRGSSVHTARWLLKQAMAKTDTHSQTRLVSLLLGGAAVFDA